MPWHTLSGPPNKQSACSFPREEAHSRKENTTPFRPRLPHAVTPPRESLAPVGLLRSISASRRRPALQQRSRAPRRSPEDGACSPSPPRGRASRPPPQPAQFAAPSGISHRAPTGTSQRRPSTILGAQRKYPARKGKSRLRISDPLLNP